MKISIIMVLAVCPLMLCGPRKFDCTETFKNRVASFEYHYYPGYWMTPRYLTGSELYRTNALKVKTKKAFQ